MALEATHIRFALDIKDHFGVKNIDEYVSGSIYPDSRYVTKIDRHLTHGRDLFEKKHTELTDFQKGWLAHLICDDIQFELTMKKFPEIEALLEGQSNQRWIDHSALKIIQDMDDAKKFDIKSYLHCLNYVANPNGEDLAKMKEYNSIFIEMYQDPEHYSLDLAFAMWQKFGIGDELTKKLKASTLIQEKDVRVRRLLSTLYDEMLDKAKTKFRT